MDTAKLFQNGRSQAVRLPKDYRFPGTQVYLRKVGEGVLLLPEKASWEPLFASLTQFSDDFMERREQGRPEARESAFE